MTEQAARLIFEGTLAVAPEDVRHFFEQNARVIGLAMLAYAETQREQAGPVLTDPESIAMFRARMGIVEAADAYVRSLPVGKHM